MSQGYTPYRTYTAYAGVLGPAIVVLGMVIAAVAFQGLDGEAYNPLNHFVSELGEPGVSKLSAAFNWALILGGLMTMPFMIVMASRLQAILSWPMGTLGWLASFFVVMVGILPMNLAAPHLVVALIFFYLSLLLSFLYTVVILLSMYRPYPRWLAYPGFLFLLVGAWIIISPPELSTDIDFQQRMGGLLQTRPAVYPLAIIEWLAVLIFLSWLFAMGVYHVRQLTREEMA